MKKIQIVKNIVFRATALSVVAMLAACGGGEEEQQTDCTENIFILLLCATFGSDNPAPIQDPITIDFTTSTGNSIVGSGVTAAIVQVDEFEPNNVLDNANIVIFTGATDGVALNGSVQNIDDVSDYFIFTPTSSGSHRIYLCADTCNQSREDDAAYIMVFDQNQTTIAGTPIGTIAQQEIAADLTAGFAYYVQVNGYNAGGEDYDYRLVVTN